MAELKTKNQAVLERPTATTAPQAKAPWQIETTRILEEHAEVERYAAEHHLTEQVAILELNSRREGQRLFPAESAKLQEKELQSASALEQVEREKMRLAALASKWSSLRAQRDNLRKMIGRLHELSARLQAVTEAAKGNAPETAVSNDWSLEVTLNQFAALLGAERGLKETAAALERQTETKLNKFAEHLEHHFARHLSRFVGPGAAAEFGLKLSEDIRSDIEKINELSKSTGMTSDEVQYLQAAAEDMGLTFETALEKAKQGAIDLARTIRDQREKGDFQIIPKEDIDSFNELMSGAVGWYRRMKSFVTQTTMGPVSAARALSHGDFGTAGLFAVRSALLFASPLLPVGVQDLSKGFINRRIEQRRPPVGQAGANWGP